MTNTNTKTAALAARLADLLQTTEPKRTSARLLALDLYDVCGRCIGNGMYGPRSVEGGVCFDCRGSGKRAPKLSAALVEAVEAKVAAGDLARYFEKRDALAAAKAKIKPLVAEIEAVLAPVNAAYKAATEANRAAQKAHIAAGGSADSLPWLTGTPRFEVQRAANALVFGDAHHGGKTYGARGMLDEVKAGRPADEAVVALEGMLAEARALAAASAVISLLGQ